MNVLLESSLRALLMAGAVAAILCLVRAKRPPEQHRAWSGIVVAMLLLPAFTTWGPKAAVFVWPAEPAVSRFRETLPTATAQLGESPRRSVEAAPPSPLPPHSEAKPGWRLDPVLAAYLLVAGVLVLRLGLGTAKIAALRRNAEPGEHFLTSAECVSPVTVGWWKPAIILPPSWVSWPQEELDAVLAHEREHVRRRDPATQWLASLNRSIFWFHPLAWWLERKVARLAEECCDAAVLAGGWDAKRYCEYLVHQARAIQHYGGRIQGTGMGKGSLEARITKLLDGGAANAAPGLGKGRLVFGAVVYAVAILGLAACQFDRVERAAPGQPSMNELMHRRAEQRRKQQEQQQALAERASALTPDQARELVAKLKQNPDDPDTYLTVLRHYERTGNVANRYELFLWYIEHRPAGTIHPGNIDAKLDPASYEKGKAIWLAHVRRAGAPVEVYLRAPDFLDATDKPLAGSVLEAGKDAYPQDRRWASAFGRHYALALLGSIEPVAAGNVLRAVSTSEAASPYAQKVRSRLAASSDVDVLAHTAQWLLVWTRRQDSGESMKLARQYVQRALSIDAAHRMASTLEVRLGEMERTERSRRLLAVHESNAASLPGSDKLLWAITKMREAVIRNGNDSERAAAATLEIAALNKSDPLYADAFFEAHILLGKAAARRGDRKAAAGELLAAARTLGSPRLRLGDFEMNLPRALVDLGERSAVAEFLELMDGPREPIAGMGGGDTQGNQSGPDSDLLAPGLRKGSLLTMGE